MAEGYELVNPGNRNPEFSGSVKTKDGSFSETTTTIDRAINPSSITSTYPLVVRDKNGKNLFYIQVLQNTNGETWVNFTLECENNGTGVAKTFLTAILNRSGTISYSIGNPTAFKNALGI